MASAERCAGGQLARSREVQVARASTCPSRAPASAPEVYAAMSARASTLAMVSAERVRDEFVKLVSAPDPRQGLTLLVDTGLSDVFLPELSALRLEVDEHHRHKDVYELSLIHI